MTTMLEKMDESVQNSIVGRFFEMKERKATVRAELRGAVSSLL